MASRQEHASRTARLRASLSLRARTVSRDPGRIFGRAVGGPARWFKSLDRLRPVHIRSGSVRYFRARRAGPLRMKSSETLSGVSGGRTGSPVFSGAREALFSRLKFGRIFSGRVTSGSQSYFRARGCDPLESLFLLDGPPHRDCPNGEMGPLRISGARRGLAPVLEFRRIPPQAPPTSS